VIIPTTASLLSPGCRRAAQYANEAKVPVSMVTSPARHPIKQPLFNAIALAAGGRGGGGKKGASARSSLGNQSWCVTFIALMVVLEDRRMEAGEISFLWGKLWGDTGLLHPYSLLHALRLTEAQQRQSADSLILSGVPEK